MEIGKTTFTDRTPVAEIHNGLVVLKFEGDRHAAVVCPPHVVRRFCETTICVLDAWERERKIVGFVRQ